MIKSKKEAILAAFSLGGYLAGQAYWYFSEKKRELEDEGGVFVEAVAVPRPPETSDAPGDGPSSQGAQEEQPLLADIPIGDE